MLGIVTAWVISERLLVVEPKLIDECTFQSGEAIRLYEGGIMDPTWSVTYQNDTTQSERMIYHSVQHPQIQEISCDNEVLTLTRGFYKYDTETISLRQISSELTTHTISYERGVKSVVRTSGFVNTLENTVMCFGIPAVLLVTGLWLVLSSLASSKQKDSGFHQEL